MKKTRIMILAAVAMLMAACSSDDESQKQSSQPESGWSELVTLTAGTPGNNGGGSGSNGPLRVKVDTSNPQKSQWETGDQLTVWTGDACSTANMSENGFSLISGADTYTGKFNGRLKSTTAPTSTTPLIAIIDNSTDKIDASAGNSVSVDLSEQVGATAESALDYELFYGTSTNATRNFNFTHKMALIGWTIKVNGASDGDKCDIVLSGTGLKNSATLDPATGTLTPGADDGTITLKDVTLTSAASTELYVVLPPGTVSSGINATLTMTDGRTAEGSLGVGAITVEENKYYIAGVNEFTPESPNYEAVDLGLSVKWATMNVGATSPEESGDFFAWGETKPYYSSLNPLTWKDGKTGYNSSSYSFSRSATTLGAGDDAATANWGSPWRMPTHAEWQELQSNCYWEWTNNYNGVAGYIVYKAKDDAHKNKCKDANGDMYNMEWWEMLPSDEVYVYTTDDPHIFLPAAGYREGTGLNNQGSYGYYWSSDFAYDDIAYRMKFGNISYINADDGPYAEDFGLYYGQPVRAVCAQ